MSNDKHHQVLIARYKVLQHLTSAGMTKNEAVEKLSITITLVRQSYTLTEDDEDWLPPFTLDAE